MDEQSIGDLLISGLDDSGKEGDQGSEVGGQEKETDDSLIRGFDDWGRPEDRGQRTEVRRKRQMIR